MKGFEVNSETKELIIADIREGKLAKAKIAKKHGIGMLYLALIIGEVDPKLWRSHSMAPRGMIKVRKDGTMSILAAVSTELGLEPGTHINVTVFRKEPNMLLKIERV